MNNCSRNLSECKVFTYKEYADIFINGLFIEVFIPSTSGLDCSKYSANLTSNFYNVWYQKFRNFAFYGNVMTCYLFITLEYNNNSELWDSEYSLYNS